VDNRIFMGVALAASAGLNAFIPLLILGLADRISSGFDLGRPYSFLSSTTGLLIVMALLTIELVVDKIPRIDHLNDLIQSSVRPAAGAVLMMAVVNEGGELHPLVAMLFGLFIAGAVHWYKTVSRPAITVSTGGVGNPVVSMVEDAMAGVLAIAAILVPLIGAILVPVSAWILHRLYRWTRTGVLSKSRIRTQ
jgi:Domain of unknown function (DUF4126)